MTLILACGAAGLVVGGISGWIEGNQCLYAENLTSQCLMQTPFAKTVSSMGSGLMAGTGAALAAVWQIQRKEQS